MLENYAIKMTYIYAPKMAQYACINQNHNVYIYELGFKIISEKRSVKKSIALKITNII